MENNQFYGNKHSKLRSKILEEYLSYSKDLIIPELPMRTFNADSKLNSTPSNCCHEKFETENLDDTFTFQELMEKEMGDGDNREKEDISKCQMMRHRQLLDTSKTWENIKSLERIFSMLEMSTETSKLPKVSSKETEIPSLLTAPKQSKPKNIFMFGVVLLFSMIKISFGLLEFLKKYFEKVLIINWGYIMKNFSAPSEYGETGKIVRSEIHCFSFLLFSPLFIIFLVSYTGLLILYLIHKMVLGYIPGSLQEKINWAYWLDKLWNKKFDF